MKLDSGAQHTLVSAKTVTRDDYTGDTVPLRMADGKEHHLPLAVVHIQLGSDHILSTVAVSDRLGDDALLGTDLPVFNELLRQATTERAHAAEVLQVQTRCQTRQAEAEKRADDEATSSSNARMTALDREFDFDDSLFSPPTERPPKTRREKREEARRVARQQLEEQQADYPEEADFQHAQRHDHTLA